MTQVTQILREEHGTLRETLAELERALEPVDLGALRRTLERLEAQLTAHRQKEEDYLFPALAHSMAVHRTPLTMVEREHGREQVYIDEIRLFIAAAEQDASFIPSVAAHVRAAVLLLNDHMWREESFIFPRDVLLSPEDCEDVLSHMQAIGPVETKEVGP
jgi:hemerythrin-like domain-containing protein